MQEPSGSAGGIECERMLVSAHTLEISHSIAVEASQTAGASLVLTEGEVADFALCVLAEGPEAAMLHIDRLRADGMRLSAVYLELLAPAARYFGALWEDDRCDFTDVTIGLGALHHMLRELSPHFRSEIECVNGLTGASVNPGRRLLLVPASGEQHSLGLLMLADFFARAGWEVRSGDAPAGGDLFRLVRDEWFDVVGLAVGCERRLELLAADIRTLRATSRNHDVQVMVGGPILTAHPEYADVVGADGMAVDAWQALQVAERLVARSGAPQENAAPSNAIAGSDADEQKFTG
jgi:methanogenic corrinoid protein MtbC1